MRRSRWTCSKVDMKQKSSGGCSVTKTVTAGRFEQQKSAGEGPFGARWAPGVTSRGRPEARGRPGRLEDRPQAVWVQEAKNAGFANTSSDNIGFAQAKKPLAPLI